MKNIAALICSAAVALAADSPTADEVIAKFMERDHTRQVSIGAYSVTSKYVLHNKGTPKWLFAGRGRPVA